MIWQKVFGSIETIVLINSTQKSSVYQLTTTEVIPVKNEQGAIIRWDKQACSVLATITDVASDGLATELQVTDVDFSGCPSVQK